jgi:hypothetical protein
VSPKVCSYHLTLLGRYGLTEETGEGKGRARPWRLAAAPPAYVHRADEGPQAADAADQFARVMLARDARIVSEFIDGRHRLPPSWRNVAAMSSTPLRLTAEQARALRAELTAVLDRYERDSGADAEGSRPVHVAVYAVPRLADPDGSDREPPR